MDVQVVVDMSFNAGGMIGKTKVKAFGTEIRADEFFTKCATKLSKLTDDEIKIALLNGKYETAKGAVLVSVVKVE